jgi:hypothetical protein
LPMDGRRSFYHPGVASVTDNHVPFLGGERLF